MILKKGIAGVFCMTLSNISAESPGPCLMISSNINHDYLWIFMIQVSMENA